MEIRGKIEKLKKKWEKLWAADHSGNLSEETLDKKFQKQGSLLLFIGAIMLIADLGASFTSNTISLEKNEQGIYMLRQNEPGHISLQARVKEKGLRYEEDFDVTISPYHKAEDEEATVEQNEEISKAEQVEQEIHEIVMGFNDDESVKKIDLPAVLSTGERVSWKVVRKTHVAIILFLVMALLVFMHRSRYAPLTRLKKAHEESVKRQLPEFINRLVLLLNAGLVLNSAFEKTIEEGIRFNHRDSDYFWKRMDEIYIAVMQTNSSVNKEFRSFAREMGTNELIRISNILNDNTSKGVELTEKLYEESEFLWMNRKRSCEEQGRIAETKLTLPLTLFLMVLVIITVSPALLEL